MATLTSFSVLLDNEGEIIIAYNSKVLLYFLLCFKPMVSGYGSPGISTLIFFYPFWIYFNVSYEKNVGICSSLSKFLWSWLHYFHVAKRFLWLYKSFSYLSLSLPLPPQWKSRMKSYHSSSCNSDELQWNHFTYLLILHWAVVEKLFQIAHCLIMV